MDAALTEVRIDFDGPLAIVVMDGAKKRNALAPQSRSALLAALRRVMYDEPQVRAIVLAGAGSHFCAGVDVSTLSRNTVLRGRFNITESCDIVRELVAGPKPVVAAVEGVAYGMGMSLAMACDLVVAGGEARFCAAFARIGLLPDTGMLWTLPKKIGLAKARPLLTQARELGGEAALALGIADQLVAAGGALEAAKERARQLASLPPLAVALTKQALATRSETLDDVLRAEIDYQAMLQSDVSTVGTADSAPVAGADAVRVEMQEAVAVVTFAADAGDTIGQLLSTLEQLMLSEEVRAIVLVPTPAGANARQVKAPAASLLQLRQRAAATARLARVIRCGAKPVLAALEGATGDQAFALAALSDIAVGASNARFSSRHVAQGRLPDLGLLWSLPQRVGGGKAREFLLSAGEFGGDSAGRIGLLNRVSGPGQSLAVALQEAQRLAKLPPVTLMLLKAALVSGTNDIATAVRHEIDLNPLVRSTHDHKEGATAFLEKRKPHFRGD